MSKIDKTTKVMKLKIAWIKIKSLIGLPIYPIDVLRWTKYYYANEDYDCLCLTIICSIRNLIRIDICDMPQNYIPLLNPDIVKTFHKNYCVDTSNTRYKTYSYWWKPYVWELDGGRLGFLNWLIEQYKDDKTNLRKL